MGKQATAGYTRPAGSIWLGNFRDGRKVMLNLSTNKCNFFFRLENFLLYRNYHVNAINSRLNGLFCFVFVFAQVFFTGHIPQVTSTGPVELV